MGLQDYKITDAAIAQKGVVAAPDKLEGNTRENKMLFDRLIRESVKTLFNGTIDALAGTGGAGEIGVAAIDGLSGANVQAALESLAGIEGEHFKDVTFDQSTCVFTFTREDDTTVTIDASQLAFGSMTANTSTNLNGVLFGNGSKVSAKALDASGGAASTDSVEKTREMVAQTANGPHITASVSNSTMMWGAGVFSGTVSAVAIAAWYDGNGHQLGTNAEPVIIERSVLHQAITVGADAAKYKLFLVDSETYAPLCPAWDGESGNEPIVSESWLEGSYFIWNDKLCRATQNIASGVLPAPGTNCVEVKVGDVLTNYERRISGNTDAVSETREMIAQTAYGTHVTASVSGQTMTWGAGVFPGAVSAVAVATWYDGDGRQLGVATDTVSFTGSISGQILTVGVGAPLYKLFLVDSETYAPLCPAWDSDHGNEPVVSESWLTGSYFIWKDTLYRATQDIVGEQPVPGTNCVEVKVCDVLQGYTAAIEGKADASALTSHTGNTTVHVTAADKTAWNGKASAADLTAHIGNDVAHITAAERTTWNGKASLGTATPKMDGTASAGSGTTASKVDHVHPTDTTRQPKTLDTPLTINSASQTTVEQALGTIAPLATMVAAANAVASAGVAPGGFGLGVGGAGIQAPADGGNLDDYDKPGFYFWQTAPSHAPNSANNGAMVVFGSNTNLTGSSASRIVQIVVITKSTVSGTTTTLNDPAIYFRSKYQSVWSNWYSIAGTIV